MVEDKRYFHPLDSLRGIAALLIILFHTGVKAFSSFWVGVPIFFVLSGFLITRILVSNKTSANYFKAFYYKRALRIFPIYYLLFAVIYLFARHNSFDTSQAIVYFFYLQSFSISLQKIPVFADGMLLHTWSLSVEELFYLCWPFIAWILSVERLRSLSIGLLTMTILFKIGLISLYPTDNNKTLLLLSFWGNLDSLMAGSLLGIISLAPSDRIIKQSIKLFPYIFTAALAVFLLTYFPVNKTSDTIIVTVLSVVIALVSPFLITRFAYTEPKAKFGAIFNNQFLRFTGKISYGIYLYHWVIYRLLDALCYHFKISDPLLVIVLKISVTFCVALSSWHLLEAPLLKLKNRVKYN